MKHHKPAAIALILGIVLSIAAFRMVDGWEKERIDIEFERLAGNLSSALQGGLDHHFEVLYSLRSFYQGSIYVDRSEFSTFLEGSMERHTGFQAIEWIPRIPSGERDQFESLARADGFEDFRITELSGDRSVAASVREEYFPVFYMEPIEGNESALGFDLTSVPDYLETMLDARDSGELVIIERKNLVHGAHDLGFHALLPVYRTDEPIETPEDRREALEGFINGVFNIEEMVSTSLEGLDLSGIGMDLHDLSAPESESYLFYAATGLRSIHLHDEYEKVQYVDFHWNVTFDIGGRDWSLTCFQTEEFMKTQTTWTKWGVLSIGLVFTLLLTAYLVVSSKRRLELERSIDERKSAELALEHRMRDLGERYKELNCIHTIVKLASQPGISPEKMVQGIVDIIPWSWQYPDITCARITLEQSTFTTENFRKTQWRLAADINIDGKKLGVVEVFYLEERKNLFEGPFVKEERDLIDSIAVNVGGFIKRIRAEDDVKLQKDIAEMESQKLRSMIEGMEEGIIVADSDDRIIEINRWALNVAGAKKEDVVGKKLWEFHTDESINRIRKILDTFRSREQKTGVVIDRELLGMSVSLRVQPIFRNDTYVGVILNVIDVTSMVKAREMAEEASRELARSNRTLEERTGQLESIFEASPMGIFLVDIENRRIIQSNSLGLKMLGLTEEECLNGNCHQSIWNEKEKTCPIFDLNQDNCEKEAWVRRPDGTEKKMVENSVKVLINGEPHVLVLLTDVTEREKADQKTARLASIVQQATENILITDTDGVIEYVNPAFEEVSGYEAQEVIGMAAIELLAENENGGIIDNVQSCLLNGVPWSGRLTRKKKDGSTYEAEESVFPVKGPKGETINSVSIARDVTEQLGLERQLRQAQKLESIGQLAAGIAHEINTPMQYVGDNTRFLMDSFSSLIGIINKYSETVETAEQGELDREMLGEIEKLSKEADVDFLADEIPQAIEQSLDGIQRVSEIVRAMKDFSHPGSEEKVVTDLNKAITSTITVARNEWKYVSELETDLDESLPGVPCFPGEINQVILNLITNAAHTIGKKLGDHPTQKGKIKISTGQVGNCAEIRISDTGTGIPEDIRERIFDPFFTTKGVGKGTGQGLSIAHAVIKDKHEGTITFETVQDEGTTFIIRLPLEPSQPEDENTAVAVEPLGREE